jgi:hypothetical protein
LTLGPRSLPWLTQKLIRNGQRLAATLTSCNAGKYTPWVLVSGHGSSRSSALCCGSRPVGVTPKRSVRGAKGEQSQGQAGDLPVLRDRLAWSRSCPVRAPPARGDTGAQRGGLLGQAMQRLRAARGHAHRPVHLRYPGPRDQRRGKLHRHSLSLSVTLSTDEMSRQAFIRSGVTGRWRPREPSAEVLRRASTRRDTSTSCWSWRDMRQKQAFAPRAAMHKYTAWRLAGRQRSG